MRRSEKMHDQYEPESTWNALETTELKSISMGSENVL